MDEFIWTSQSMISQMEVQHILMYVYVIHVHVCA